MSRIQKKLDGLFALCEYSLQRQEYFTLEEAAQAIGSSAPSVMRYLKDLDESEWFIVERKHNGSSVKPSDKLISLVNGE